jgi:hypothetical protein
MAKMLVSGCARSSTTLLSDTSIRFTNFEAKGGSRMTPYATGHPGPSCDGAQTVFSNRMRVPTGKSPSKYGNNSLGDTLLRHLTYKNVRAASASVNDKLHQRCSHCSAYASHLATQNDNPRRTPWLKGRSKYNVTYFKARSPPNVQSSGTAAERDDEMQSDK